MRERGNILFLILLAVVLFAALSYAVTSSLRGGGKDGSEEVIQANIAPLFQTLDEIDVAVMRMSLSKNIPVQNISFEYLRTNGDGSTQMAYPNTNCLTSACRIFLPAGGGAVFPGFEKLGIPLDGSGTAPGHFDIVVMNYPYAGTSANDVVLRVLKIAPAYCAKINEILSIASPPVVSGTYNAANVPANWDNAGLTVMANASQLIGKNTFATSVASGYCAVIHLLITR